MTDSQIKNIIFIIIAFFLFFIEICLFSLCKSHIFLPTVCMIITLLSNSYTINNLIFPLFFASLLSYLDTQIAGFSLIYLVPTLLYAKFLDEHLYVKKIIPYLLLLTTLIVHAYAISWITKTSISISTISSLIWYNTICLVIFLMIYKKMTLYFPEET